ncbi:MAG TPA: hypothetical protein VE907_07570, partial [Gammaproteobacteria bacterium]|nr:hypothetical protein [Gammaproteobacteria bacterium]
MKSQTTLTRRRLLGTTATAGAVLAFPGLRARAAGALADEVLSVSAAEAAKLLREGRVSAVDLVKKCYARI